jgi:O-antigen/teichoic acid export membrane protein
MKLILPLIALGAAVTIFGGRLVLSIFGSGYAGHGYLLLVLLSLAAFPDAVVNIYRSVLRVRRRYKTATAICWAISIVRIVLTWFGVARFGIVGAGWAWLITQTGGAIWCVLDLAVHRKPATLPDTYDDDSILDQTLELRRIEW